jgi:nuclear pore complex protein Nup210
MAGSWKVTGIITGILVIFVVHAQNSKLNVPRVLLPLFKEFCTNFTLEVSDTGCYKWWVGSCCKVICDKLISLYDVFRYWMYVLVTGVSSTIESDADAVFVI